MAFLLWLVLLAAFLSISRIFFIGYRRRSHINNLRESGIAVAPGWSWWTGHLLVLKNCLSTLPPDASIFMGLQKLCEEHYDTETVLLDLWPAAKATLIVFGPESAFEVSNKFNLPKPESQVALRQRTIGGQSILTMNGKEWKKWRALFNPGFSASHVAKLTPSIVESAETLCEVLGDKCGRGVFQLEHVTTRLTMEVISKVALGIDADNQHSEHSLSYAFNSIVRWNSYWNASILLKPIKFVSQIYHGRVLESIIATNLEKRYQEMLVKDVSPTDSDPVLPVSIMSLALDDYIKDRREEKLNGPTNMSLDPKFAKIASNQIRSFLMAGNDSTSATLCHIYNILSKYPKVLSSLRQEHDEVLGVRSEDAAGIIKQNPAILNQCRYTLAVIKETLRLYSPASTQRSGLPNVFIEDLKGNFCPTEDIDVMILHRAVHMNPRLWAKPDEYIPERWLADSSHELHTATNSGAFRPFEHGPRNCIGQTLANTEISVVLALTARSFNITPAYEEWDIMQHELSTGAARLAHWRRPKLGAIRTVGNERAYSTSRAGGYPPDGYPCRVSLRRP